MKIFISHSSHDKWIARKISEDLVARGFETFLDEKDIKTGESIDKAIGEHLRDCDELLLLLSPQSKGSNWVFIEIGGAKALQKGVATILINLGANDVPAPLNEALVRDLNEIERYYAELKQRMGGSQKRKRRVTKATTVRPKDRKSLGVGSHVTIADPNLLSDAVKQQNPRWVSGMDRFSGKTTVINEVAEKGFYRVQIDNGDYLWHADWLQ